MANYNHLEFKKEFVCQLFIQNHKLLSSDPVYISLVTKNPVCLSFANNKVVDDKPARPHMRISTSVFRLAWLNPIFLDCSPSL